MGHPSHFGDHRQERRQTGLEPWSGVAHGDARLRPVLVPPAGGIQVQRVTLLGAGQLIQAPTPPRTEAPQVLTCRTKALEETRPHRRTGHAGDPQQFGHQRITPQIGHRGELARLTEPAGQEGQRLFQREPLVVESGPEAAARGRAQSRGRSQPQNVARPACGESCRPGNSTAMAWPTAWNSNPGATLW